MNTKIYQKKCPLCDNIQVYTDKYHLHRAIITNAICKICTRKLPSKKRQNLTNNVYGHLKVLYLDSKKGNNQYWKCKCDCGNETIVRHSHLTGHTVRTCGCSHLVLQDKHPHWKGIGKISGSFLNQICKGAKIRNLDFLITKEDMWNLFLKQNGKCALTGIELKFDSCLKVRDGNASLDRIDSTKGYTLDNVQWVHKIINNMKNDLTETEFFNWCKLICDRRLV